MSKVHLRTQGVDCRGQGQTQHEYTHQTACGFVRDRVTTKHFEVTCFYCKKTKEFDELQNYDGEGL